MSNIHIAVSDADAAVTVPATLTGGMVGASVTFTFTGTAWDGLTKVAQLVRSFIQLGGHQLQLNSVNVDQLRDAQTHPENYANLIVRVWGWSGRFVLLDRAYQEQIIARTSYSV